MITNVARVLRFVHISQEQNGCLDHNNLQNLMRFDGLVSPKRQPVLHRSKPICSGKPEKRGRRKLEESTAHHLIFGLADTQPHSY